MHRPRYRWFFIIPVLAVLALSVSACGGGPEDAMIRKFFQASRMGDNMTLANIATVSFDPSRDGIAQNVKIVSVTPEQTRTLQFKELEKARQEAVAAEAEFSKKMKAYQDDNLDAINRVLKIEQSNGTVRGKDAAVQSEWSKFREEQKEFNRKVSEARSKLNTERRVADLSVVDHDPTGFDGTESTKEATVTANVRTPDGQSTEKTYVLTLQRVVLKDPAGTDIVGRWMITHIKEGAPAS
jgi:Skp family chaperone for outer membrane proteins